MIKAILCILDGFGFGDKNNPYNAVEQANTPTLDYLQKTYNIIDLKTSGEAVGLPEGQMGNSEVGHMAIGSGRIIYQNLPRINNAIKNDELNVDIGDAKNVHLIGLLSEGGVHSSGSHILYLAKKLEKQGKNIFIHAISDGRDCPPNDGLKYITEFDKKYKISTLCGRFYAMDRDNRTERTEKYYNLLAKGQGIKMNSVYDALKEENDECVEPTFFDDFDGIKNGDAIIFCNFRSDRMKQIASFLLDRIEFSKAICITDYGIKNKCDILFEKINIKNGLSEVISNNGLKQLHIAETEKYAHVTFFFNGGIEEPFNKEDRILIPSPNVATYDLQPEMSCRQVVETVINSISKYDFIVINIANCDMVGHTGNFEATKKAVECVDFEIKKLVDICEKMDITMLITADHGNAECMMDIDNLKHTRHTTLNVPLILINKKHKFIKKEGTLSDIAPTILKIMNIEKPSDMTGNCLL